MQCTVVITLYICMINIRTMKILPKKSRRICGKFCLQMDFSVKSGNFKIVSETQGPKWGNVQKVILSLWDNLLSNTHILNLNLRTFQMLRNVKGILGWEDYCNMWYWNFREAMFIGILIKKTVVAFFGWELFPP